ncbi:MAG: hypothetical protein HYV77_01950 [Candidatus Wildermuthbacteria bacterium]|nr:hypothetical protein [Candidatus Wildermuthbacteria bacterium]
MNIPTDFKGSKLRVEGNIRFKENTRLEFIVSDDGVTDQGISCGLWVWKTGRTILEEQEVAEHRIDLEFPMVSLETFRSVTVSFADLVSFRKLPGDPIIDGIEKVLFRMAVLSVKVEGDKVLFTITFEGMAGEHSAECELTELKYWLKE